MTSAANEPSLEEILSSIRRIISEDGPSAASASLAAAPVWPSQADEDVLVLTRRVTMNGQPFLHDGPSPTAEVVAPPLEPEAKPAAPVAADLAEPVLSKPEEPPVMAEEPESKAAAAFDKLDAAVQVETPRGPSILMPAAGRTLEDVIREMMQPLIKDWLDENLAALVEARVDEEIERIARRRVR